MFNSFQTPEKDIAILVTARELGWLIDGLGCCRSEGMIAADIYGVHQMLSERLRALLPPVDSLYTRNGNESARLDLL